jgi:endonuclease YncB( thermonuclease family)
MTKKHQKNKPKNKKLFKNSLKFINSLFFIAFLVIIYRSSIDNELFASKGTSQTYYLENNLSNHKVISGKAFIIDGDSIRIGEKEIRLKNIDAPEYFQKCFNKSNKKYNCGQVSKKYLISLTKNKDLNCYFENKDFYNRYLAICKMDNININHKLVEDGMAIIYSYKASSSHLKNLEKQARINKVGIWQGAFEIPKNYRKNNKK